jgi:SAM-dependent methyltransferase
MDEGIEEVRRVLKPGGKAIIMLYHKGFKYYVRKLFFEGVLKGKYLKHSTQEIINKKTEEFGDSPCTLVVNRKEARQLFKNYSRIESMTGHRIDDYLILGKKWVSPTYMLPRPLRNVIEDRYGWNLVIKAIK